MKRLDNKELSKRLTDNYYKKFGTTREKESKRIKLTMKKYGMLKYANVKLEDLEYLLKNHKHLLPIN